MHGCDVENVDEVPYHLTSVGWNDGDIQQLKATFKKEIGDQCLQYKNIKCKQSAKRSGVEQMCDVCIIFLLLKQLERETTIDSLPFDSLSDELADIFEKLNNDGINIKQNKVRTLKDFLVRLPYMLDKTCTVDNIRKGFVSVGMLDAKHHLWPDFNEILKTKRQNITKTGMELIEKTFS